MDSSLWAVILLFLSLTFLFAEVFIPSGGMLAIGALVCFCASLWCAWTAWWHTQPILWWAFAVTAVLLIPTVLGGAIQLWPHTSMGKKMEPPSPEEVTPYLEEERRLQQLIGVIGETLTPLTPGGIVRIAGQRIHCFSEGMLVDRGALVKLIAVRGTRVTVREVTSEERHAAQQQLPGQHPPAEPPLDFDLPTG